MSRGKAESSSETLCSRSSVFARLFGKNTQENGVQFLGESQSTDWYSSRHRRGIGRSRQRQSRVRRTREASEETPGKTSQRLRLEAEARDRRARATRSRVIRLSTRRMRR